MHLSECILSHDCASAEKPATTVLDEKDENKETGDPRLANCTELYSFAAGEIPDAIPTVSHHPVC